MVKNEGENRVEEGKVLRVLEWKGWEV
jgi:hypothetical protein